MVKLLKAQIILSFFYSTKKISFLLDKRDFRLILDKVIYIKIKSETYA